MSMSHINYCEDINVLVTGAGAPGIIGTIYALKNNYDNRVINIVGTDAKLDVIGNYTCDKFYQIPPARESDIYLDRLFEICLSEEIDIVIPQNTMELELLAQNSEKFASVDVGLLIPSVTSITTANNKYKLLEIAREIGVPTGKFFLVDSYKFLKEKALELDWPRKRVVVKVPVSNGMRGLRIIDENIDSLDHFLNSKPSDVYINLEHFESLFEKGLGPVMICEYLPGEEYTVDFFRNNDHSIILPRKRISIRSGISFDTKFEKNEEIIYYSKRLAEHLGLINCFGFQFKFDSSGTPVLLECNPRVQGTMISSIFANQNIIYHGVKNLLGEKTEMRETIWDVRFIRYWGGVAITPAGNKWL